MGQSSHSLENRAPAEFIDKKKNGRRCRKTLKYETLFCYVTVTFIEIIGQRVFRSKVGLVCKLELRVVKDGKVRQYVCPISEVVIMRHD